MQGNVTLKWKSKPKQVILLHDGKEVPFTYKNKEVYISLPNSRRGFIDDVLKIVWE